MKFADVLIGGIFEKRVGDTIGLCFNDSGHKVMTITDIRNSIISVEDQEGKVISYTMKELNEYNIGFYQALDSGKLIKEVSDLTEENQHDEARVLLASSLGYMSLLEQYESIRTVSKGMGYTPSNLIDYRYQLDQKLKSIMISILGEDLAMKYYTCL